MSCGHDHCTCDTTRDADHERPLPTVSDQRPAERASGCCGGRYPADHAEPHSEPTR